MTQLNPYLSFNGKAEEAFNFYRSVFGGEFAGVMRWGDNPDACAQFPDLDKNAVMHIAMPIGDSMIMASDNPSGDVKEGNNFSVAIGPDSREEALHAGHHPDLQHHFDDMEQQKEASSLGMWVFLAQEVMYVDKQDRVWSSDRFVLGGQTVVRETPNVLVSTRASHPRARKASTIVRHAISYPPV